MMVMVAGEFPIEVCSLTALTHLDISRNGKKKKEMGSHTTATNPYTHSLFFKPEPLASIYPFF
jgi:hypothetical protein